MSPPEPIVPGRAPGRQPRRKRQRYLGKDPFGIDARYVWKEYKIRGQGVRLIDIERGWETVHEDLPNNIQFLGGENVDYKNHGTRVLGVLVANPGKPGGSGIAPDLDLMGIIGHVSNSEVCRKGSKVSRLPQALLNASTYLRDGDVLLLEAQISEGRYTNAPVEMDEFVRELITLLTQAGITVIEPAGNGGIEMERVEIARSSVLRLPIDAPSRTNDQIKQSGFMDSGAIMVGAGVYIESSSGANGTIERLVQSGRGRRVDCFAWGEGVFTTDSLNPNHPYTKEFNGTSAASAIIAGAACLVQSFARQHFGQPLRPALLRELFADPDLGTALTNGDTASVGVMPDLQEIIDEMASYTSLADLYNNHQPKKYKHSGNWGP